MTLKFKHKIVLAALVCFVVGLAMYFGRTSGKQPSETDASAANSNQSANQSALQANGLLKHSIEIGVVRSYTFIQELSVELSSEQGQTTTSQIQVRGQLDEQLMAIQGRQLSYRFKFANVRFESNDERGQPTMPPAETEAISKALGDSTLLLKTDAQRSALSWSVDKSTTLESLNLLRGVVLSASLFLPDSRELSEWTASEEDSTGVFTHTFRLKSFADGKAVIEKEPRMVRIQSDGTQGGAGQQLVVILPSSITKVDFDAAAGHVLKSDQRWAMRAQTAGIFATTQLRTEVVFQNKRPASDQERQFVQGAAGGSSQEFVSEFELAAAHAVSTKRKVAAQKLNGETWLSLRERFMAADFHKDGAARAQFFEQLSALLYLQPELCTSVAEEIAKLDKNDPDYKSKLALLSGVFSSQETPEAEAAMAALAERLKDDSVALMQVIPALAAHRNPSERTRDVLMQTYTSAVDEGVKSTATLALGTFASRARSGRPELTRETVDRLKQDFDSTSAESRKVTISGALGNAGATEALDSVKVLYAQSPDASLKRSAIYDLRYVDHPDADTFLQKIAGDSGADPELVIQGVRVMRMRPPQKMHLQACVAIFRAPSSRPSLRTEALYTIAYLAPVAPDEVRKILNEATSDANAQIAKQAEQLLARQPQAL